MKMKHAYDTDVISESKNLDDIESMRSGLSLPSGVSD